MAGNSRLALARVGTVLFVVALVACTGDARPTASPHPSPTEVAQSLPPPSPRSPPGPTAPPTAAQTATPALSPSAATSPSVAAGTAGPTAAAGSPWQYLADFATEGAIEVSSVTGTPTGFVAVGYQPMPGEGYYGRRQGVVWRSTDGIAWERLLPVEFELASLDHVVRLGDQLYAFGVVSACEFNVDDECTDIPEAGWTVWTSSDGAVWSKLPQSPSMRAELIDGVIPGESMLVVHGSAGDELEAVVWLSADGVTWEETRELAGLDPISAIASGPEGLVALGTEFVPALDNTQALAAFSADGRSFQPSQLPAGLPLVFDSVASGDAGYVAVGHSGEEDLPPMGAAMSSADGINWSVAPDNAELADVRFEHVNAVPGGYQAIGSMPEGSFGLQVGSTWFSSDGLAWTEVGDLPDGAYQELGGSAVGPAGMVIFATDFEEQGADIVVSTIHPWFAPLDRLDGLDGQ